MPAKEHNESPLSVGIGSEKKSLPSHDPLHSARVMDRQQVLEFRDIGLDILVSHSLYYIYFIMFKF